MGNCMNRADYKLGSQIIVVGYLAQLSWLGLFQLYSQGKKTLEQHASISLPPLLQPSAFHQKQALPAQSTRAEFADGKKLQASNVSLKQFHWSPSDSHVAHKNVPETAVYCYPREVNGRTSWKILLEDASKLDGYKKMYANKKKRTETEVAYD